MPHLPAPPSFALVTSVSSIDVLQQRLAPSPCLQRGGLRWSAHFNCSSAAEAFEQARLANQGGVEWLVWIHQDVYLPQGWEQRFGSALQQAIALWPNLAVAGVYGVQGSGDGAVRAGNVLDRGQVLHEPAPLPCLVDSLDELLVAVRLDAGLRMDPAMGFDFYATDLVLQAQEAGLCAAAIDAFCEHWSETPSAGAMPASLTDRVRRNAQAFEGKWAHRLPIQTPCFDIRQPGDVAAFIEKITTSAP